MMIKNTTCHKIIAPKPGKGQSNKLQCGAQLVCHNAYFNTTLSYVTIMGASVTLTYCNTPSPSIPILSAYME